MQTYNGTTRTKLRYRYLMTKYITLTILLLLSILIKHVTICLHWIY